jgi:hypothetical protein
MTAFQDIKNGVGKVLNTNPNDDREGLSDIGRGVGKLLGKQLDSLVMPKPSLENLAKGVGKFAANLDAQLEEKKKKEEEQERLQKLREAQGFEKKDSKSPVPESMRRSSGKDQFVDKKDKNTEADFHEPSRSSKHSPHGAGLVHHAKGNAESIMEQHEGSTVPHGSEVLSIRDLKNQSGATSGMQLQVLREAMFGFVNPTRGPEVERLLAMDKEKNRGPFPAEKESSMTARDKDREKLRSFMA